MRYKKIVNLSVILIILLLFTSCNSNNKISWPAEPKKNEEVKSDKVSQLNMVYPQLGNIPKDINEVVSEVNKISKYEINTTIKMTGISVVNYAQQCRLMIASQDKMDLIVTGTLGFIDFTGQVANNQLLPLNNLIEKGGHGIKASVGEFLEAAKVKGDIYGVPTLRDEAKAAGFAIRKDLVEKLEIDISKIRSLEDIEPILKLVMENDPDIAPFYPGQEATHSIDTAMRVPNGDTLASDYYFSGVLMNALDNRLKAVNYYETLEYASQIKLMRKWNRRGYIFPGIINNNESSYILVKEGKLASFLQDIKPGIEGQVSRQCARDMVVVALAPIISSTNVVTAFVWSIPYYAKTPEKSMDFLNLMYTDSRIINLLDWGIEGKHYVKQPDGTIDYPPGVNAYNTGYGMNSGFIFGNQLLSYVWKGDPVDLWKQVDEFNKTAIKSKAFGFQFDSTPVRNEYAACLSVWQQYQRPLGVGAVNPEKILPEFISKLKAAGVDSVVAEKQRQLDLWTKGNSVK
ncbi:putative aldouronate transport system substrate-binding protein [Anaerobacterium chartisolvens]|uniref:Putative aldouronate transport system substrate-binding protein n=1 Tax=Anaerobacterium chartisolvens TaxID=1297424 RepID=A0A369AL70_9FIRM|nr:ABC transporter substrate-binding protein [Anaerobacterium chartisolvens]RCX09921.1 putative aldouronate transport system substrate-binding protein [Anaerobacterium chartisolvens]